MTANLPTSRVLSNVSLSSFRLRFLVTLVYVGVLMGSTVAPCLCSCTLSSKAARETCWDDTAEDDDDDDDDDDAEEEHDEDDPEVADEEDDEDGDDAAFATGNAAGKCGVRGLSISLHTHIRLQCT